MDSVLDLVHPTCSLWVGGELCSSQPLKDEGHLNPCFQDHHSRGKGMVQWLYVSYRLLHNRSPPTCIYYVTISVDLNWIFQFSVSHQIAVKVSAGAAVISRFNWARIHFQAHSHGCCGWGPEAIFSFLLVAFFIRASKREGEREEKREGGWERGLGRESATRLP